MDDWLAFVDVMIGISALKADLETFFRYADRDGSGGLDVSELQVI